ncbi:hypothetical protein [Phenylobacterium sp.]|uniref:hypothetical protein n=1 Tax=Phenylobacterium sp. TaxID=1871053 RepID=UPI00391D1BB3
MTPEIPAVLGELAGLLMKNADPSVPPAERTSDLMLSAMLLVTAAETWDRAAHVLVEENRAVRALLGEKGEDADLRISALTAENNRLRGRLIDRHAAAEAAGDTATVEAIWAELIAGTERRRLSGAPA